MQGKVVLVTGAAAGIGLACAEAFACAGAVVVMVDIHEPVDQAARLVQAGYAAVPYCCDVSDTRAVEAMVEWIVATYGRLDAAHNNAGIQTPQRPMAEITDEEFDRTVAVDLKGVWNCMRYEIRQMLKQGGGAIVNTSSQGGVTGFPGQAAYIACKHAVIGLTRTAAIDYAAPGDTHQCRVSRCHQNPHGRRAVAPESCFGARTGARHSGRPHGAPRGDSPCRAVALFQ